MESDQGAAASVVEPEAASGGSDSFSQLWTDVMGMLVSVWVVVEGEGRQESNTYTRKALDRKSVV